MAWGKDDGHEGRIDLVGAREWYCFACSCGFTGEKYAIEEQAMLQGIWHLRTPDRAAAAAAKEARRNGVSTTAVTRPA